MCQKPHQEKGLVIEDPSPNLGLHVQRPKCTISCCGGILALRAHCALLLDYVPPEEPLGTPLGNTLRTRRPKLDWRGP